MDNRALLPETTQQPLYFFNLHSPWKLANAWYNTFGSVMLNSLLFMLLGRKYPSFLVQMFFLGIAITGFLQGGFQQKWVTTLFDYPAFAEVESNVFFSRKKPRMSLFFSVLFACIETLRTFIILEFSYGLGEVSGYLHRRDMPNAEKVSLDFLFLLGVASAVPTALFIYLSMMLTMKHGDFTRLGLGGVGVESARAMGLLFSCPDSVEGDHIDGEVLNSINDIRASLASDTSSTLYYGNDRRSDSSVTTERRESIMYP